MNLMEALISAKLGGSGGGGAGGGSGMTEDVKQAFLNAFTHVAWTDEHGQDYYDALEAAFYPPADLVSISAVYTQSGTVYDTDSLDSLRADLVVTATYSNGDVRTVTNYTLNGTLAEGTSTITVLYGGKSTTFNVTVTEKTISVIDGTSLTWTRGYIDASGNISTTGAGNGTWTGSYIPVEVFNTATVALDGSTAQRIAYFDENQSIISREMTAESNIPAGAVYARATVVKASLGNTSYDGTGTTITLS